LKIIYLFPKIAILLLWLGATIDPVGAFLGIRYVALSAMLLAVIYLLIFGLINNLKLSIQWIFIFVFSGVIPIYGLVLYSFQSGDGEFIDTSYIASGVLMIGSLLYCNKSMCEFGVRAMVLSGRLISISVGILLLSQIYSTEIISNFFLSHSIAFLGYREYYNIRFPYLYMIASPLLILLLAYDYSRLKQDINVKNVVFFTVTALALALTGTRAHILLSLVFIFLFTLFISNRNILNKLFFIFISLFFLILSIDVLEGVIFSFFSSEESNNSTKLSMLRGYEEIFSNPANLIFGQGFNAHEWSLPLVNMINMEVGASKTELTYIEIIRVFGVFVGSCIFLLLFTLLIAVRGMVAEYDWIYLGLLMLLINASINPYLFSTNGILPLGLFVAMASNDAFKNKVLINTRSAYLK